MTWHNPSNGATWGSSILENDIFHVIFLQMQVVSGLILWYEAEIDIFITYIFIYVIKRVNVLLECSSLLTKFSKLELDTLKLNI